MDLAEYVKLDFGKIREEDIEDWITSLAEVTKEKFEHKVWNYTGRRYKNLSEIRISNIPHNPAFVLELTSGEYLSLIHI